MVNVNIEIISLIILIFLAMYLGFRHTLQMNQFKSQQFFIVSFFIALLMISSLEIVLFRGDMSLDLFERYTKVLLTFVFSIFLTLISFICIKQVTFKKIQAIWKIPIIAIFAAMFLEFQYVIYVCFGYFTISLYILLRERVKYRYLLVKFILLIPAVILCFFVKIHNIELLNLVLIWLLVFGSPVLTIANINSRFKVKDD
ncbi:MAG: hypothetical protein HON90_00945 [Halobacteriovoraceae bacterium]|jgi:hypothetical protein|nr:hypothetical protein [Halobacteriovoraceae bacterium]